MHVRVSNFDSVITIQSVVLSTVFNLLGFEILISFALCCEEKNSLKLAPFEIRVYVWYSPRKRKV